MFQTYVPEWQLTTIYDLTPEQLKARHISLLLTDLDNTLVPWNHKEKTPRLTKWLQTMTEAGIQVVVISNNKDERVKKVVEPLGIDYIARAKKPFTKGIKQAMQRYHKTADEVVLVGDQLMTDIKAANTAGIHSILVKPLVDSDAWNTKINRGLEVLLRKAIGKQVQWRWEDRLI